MKLGTPTFLALLTTAITVPAAEPFAQQQKKPATWSWRSHFGVTSPQLANTGDWELVSSSGSSLPDRTLVLVTVWKSRKDQTYVRCLAFLKPNNGDLSDDGERCEKPAYD